VPFQQVERWQARADRHPKQCVDIIFTDDKSKIPEVTTESCFNSSTIKVDSVKIDLGSSGASGTAATTEPSRTGLFTSNSPSATAPRPNQGAAKHVSGFLAFVSLLLAI